MQKRMEGKGRGKREYKRGGGNTREESAVKSEDEEMKGKRDGGKRREHEYKGEKRSRKKC